MAIPFFGLLSVSLNRLKDFLRDRIPLDGGEVKFGFCDLLVNIRVCKKARRPGKNPDGRRGESYSCGAAGGSGAAAFLRSMQEDSAFLISHSVCGTSSMMRSTGA